MLRLFESQGRAVLSDLGQLRSIPKSGAASSRTQGRSGPDLFALTSMGGIRSVTAMRQVETSEEALVVAMSRREFATLYLCVVEAMAALPDDEFSIRVGTGMSPANC